MPCSIAVVGGGIVGVAAAYFLAKRGCSVALVERETIGSGATGRSLGILHTGIAAGYAAAIDGHGPEKARTLWNLSAENHRILRDLRIECDYDRRGLCRAGDQKSVELLRRDGFRAERTDTPFAGGYFPDDAEFHPAKFVRGLATAAERAGAKIFENSPVTSLEGPVVVTRAGRLRAEMVLLATNAFTPALHGFFDEIIAPVRGQCIATEPLSSRVLPAPVINGMDYLRQLPDGRVLAFGGRHVSPNQEYTLAERTTDPIQRYLEDVLLRRVSVPPRLRVTHRWAGIMAFTCDELPCIGPLPGTVHTYAAVGWHGSGLAFGLVSAKMVSEMMLDGRTGYPSEIFSVRRHL